MKNEAELQALISAAINAAVETSMQNIDNKLQVAINLGVKIGAAAGAEIGAKAAVRAIRQERKTWKQKSYDWKYHNTKLLLRNYRRLDEYYRNAVFDTSKMQEEDVNFEELMKNLGHAPNEEMFVESIKRNYLITKIIMTHVNKMLDCYKIMCERSSRMEDKRHWRILQGLYISDDYTTAEQIAKQENIDKRTVYKDIDVCATDLTALLFGIAGIESDKKA